MAEQSPATTGLVWFRGTLRLRDNTALYHALSENERVCCLYVLDDTYLKSGDIGAARVAFLLESLTELAASIESHGGQLIVRHEPDVPAAVVAAAKQCGAGRIYFNEDYLPYPIERDRKVSHLAHAEGVECKPFRDVLLVHPAVVLTDEERPYSVFSPFKRRWERHLNTPDRYPVEPLLHKLKQNQTQPSGDLPTLKSLGLHLSSQIEPGGERRAYARLEEFLRDGLPHYHQNRNNAADPNSTSRLSMHLKWGTVSLRDCYREARRQNGPGADKWIDELAWREFYYGITFHFPHSLTGPMLPEYSGFPWSSNQDHFEAWKAGMTGYPYVDAGMRQMNAIGWMHNRLRQVVASYLCKDLLINWQDGERYFMQQLVDGDWPSNNGGWQWVAGTGTDPRRATRIFNPTRQMEQYDPEAEYVRQWVPEFGTPRYPTRPIVPHAEGRERFMEAFGSTAAGREAIRQARREEQEAERRSRKSNRRNVQAELF
jgi:deoxyribodipyrimidine photo-lyase